MIQTISSKLLFAALSPFAFLAGYGLLNYVAQADASYVIPLSVGDLWMIGYMLAGLLLWGALIFVTDMPGIWHVVTQSVWSLKILFNVGAIWFWTERAGGTWRLKGSFNESAGIDYAALGIVYPVLAISTFFFIVGFFKPKPTTN